MHHVPPLQYFSRAVFIVQTPRGIKAAGGAHKRQHRRMKYDRFAYTPT